MTPKEILIMKTPDQKNFLSRVESAIACIKAGQMVIMVDSENRENEGDLVLCAELATTEDLAFMAKKASGLICLTLEPSIVERLQLPLMDACDVKRDPSSHSTAFTVSIDARHGISTGISASDRICTIAAVIHPGAQPNDVVVPGHMFPLVACEDGVLARAGHTEGSVDLMRLAGMVGAAVICEIMNDDGSMSRMPELNEFAHQHGLMIVSIDDIIQYRNYLAGASKDGNPTQDTCSQDEVFPFKIKEKNNNFLSGQGVIS